ncbi:MAG: ATP-binding cassette domain-containing protein [Pirellulales bacterium]
MELVIQDLSKCYANGVQALDRISMTIPKGMFGLLGPNGAGKSTLMRTIATLQDADSGSIRLGDLDVLANKHELRKKLGYLPQEFGVFPRTSALELLNHLAILKGILHSGERKVIVEGLLARVNLWDHRRKAVASYSGGMRQRFGIAQALLGDPQLLIVDEPTAGPDPGERNRFYNLLAEVGETSSSFCRPISCKMSKSFAPTWPSSIKGGFVTLASPRKPKWGFKERFGRSRCRRESLKN